MGKYNEIVNCEESLQELMNTVITTYNQQKHRGINGKSPNEIWGDILQQIITNFNNNAKNEILTSRNKTRPGGFKVTGKNGDRYTVKDFGGRKQLKCLNRQSVKRFKVLITLLKKREKQG